MSAALTVDEEVALRSILSVDEPLGPSNAANMVNSPIAANLLFEKQNTIYGELMTRSGILVGRRGSGKTAFLNQLRSSARYEYIVSLNAPNVFPEILRSIREVFGVQTPFVEVVERLWDVLIWSCVFAKLLGKKTRADARLQVIRNYANWIGFDSNSQPEVVILKVIQRLSGRAAGESLPVDSPLRLDAALSYDPISFNKAHEVAVRILRNGFVILERAPVLVLMDTLEDYSPKLNEASLAVAGLLRYLGHQASNRGLLDIRFCLPTELYSEFHDVSTNAMKDFSSQTILHWHAGDLLRVAAHRLSLYMRVYEADAWESVAGSVDLNKRESAHDFLCSILPKKLSSRGGFTEHPIAYILRHTQLLPRHVIEIFNRMVTASMRGLSKQRGETSEEIVLRSVQESLDNILGGVSKAYEHQYPHLKDLCRGAIPELPRRFRKGDLHKIFNVHVKPVLGRLRNEGKELDLDIYSFERMLIEIGAVGKQISETELYYEAEFEYTIPRELVIAYDDFLCIHPLFSGCFPKTSAELSDRKRIYPYGSDPLSSH